MRDNETPSTIGGGKKDENPEEGTNSTKLSLRPNDRLVRVPDSMGANKANNETSWVPLRYSIARRQLVKGGTTRDSLVQNSREHIALCPECVGNKEKFTSVTHPTLSERSQRVGARREHGQSTVCEPLPPSRGGHTLTLQLRGPGSPNPSVGDLA